ncbi:TPR-like protein [Gloeophyllum trabeum ATCC 11539]|uniref:ER membrane protein complex subunit 2 n=1 Tax=Gloeophyllum trabeum (strain ATCC 11539 / FP-39264 / Madison 617) TaxID=670483 RepID=S7PWN1_GLOTA|nr:TPR-like protein [Gloeophyllum trabeum ATCC 11539]EPQ51792.1 TPR-like protein [Gloeophyllum trabeum ATCC 11539]
MDLPSALQKLSIYRSRNTRASQETFDKGLLVLKGNGLKKLGDEGWAFLEQLALAAIDVGRLDIADRCLQLLTEKFPGSPRVDCLNGIRKEVTESPEAALAYYNQLLEADPVNVAFWKRKISVLRRIGRIDEAVDELIELLDTFYTDVEGWLELADIYSSCHQYTSSLQSLSHVLLLAPQNPFYVLRFAETAYTAGDVPLAIKSFLNVIDMADSDEDAPIEQVPSGFQVRAWLGIKLCSRRLLQERRLPSPSQTPVPEHLQLIDELATERLKTVYAGRDKSDKEAHEILEWLSRG